MLKQVYKINYNLHYDYLIFHDTDINNYQILQYDKNALKLSDCYLFEPCLLWDVIPCFETLKQAKQYLHTNIDKLI